jgi:hypothetical protein
MVTLTFKKYSKNRSITEINEMKQMEQAAAAAFLQTL